MTNLTTAALIVNVIDILQQSGNSVVEQIKKNLASTGTNATGSTSNSLRVEVKNEGFKQILKIYGRPYFMTVETGRKATPDYKPSQQFVASIREWMQAKNVEGSAYGIAQDIHKKGSKLFRDGGRTDIVSNVVNETFTQQLSKAILDEFAKSYLTHTVNLFNSGRNVNT
jgi:hypothetical protein